MTVTSNWPPRAAADRQGGVCRLSYFPLSLATTGASVSAELAPTTT